MTKEIQHDMEEQQRLPQEARPRRISQKAESLELTAWEEIMIGRLSYASVHTPVTKDNIQAMAHYSLEGDLWRGDIDEKFGVLGLKLEDAGLILLKRTSKENDKTGYFLMELDIPTGE